MPFRQIRDPATGEVIADCETDDEAAWDAIIALPFHRRRRIIEMLFGDFSATREYLQRRDAEAAGNGNGRDYAA